MKLGTPRPREERPAAAFLRSGLQGVGAVTLAVVALSAAAAVIAAVVALIF